MDLILERVTAALRGLPFLRAVVLGGSRATKSDAASSDYDIGIYYDRQTIDYAALNAAAKALDDAHRDNLVCEEGGWGAWVNCGGWLKINGCAVDLILRDWARVKGILRTTEQGLFSCHYQTGHPHAFPDLLYRGELACCRPLWIRDPEFAAAKAQAERYPAALKKALIDFFGFEAGFCALFVEKYAVSGDLYYLTGHLFRAVSALNQLLFAQNEVWLLNEKKAVLRAQALPLKPADYRARVEALFCTLPADPETAARELRALCDEALSLCSDALSRPKAK